MKYENEKIMFLFESVKSKKNILLFNPYDEVEEMRFLQKGVRSDLYTQEELDNVLEEMKKTDRFKRLNKTWSTIYKKDHTPFATSLRFGKKENLEDYGYHAFIGREIYDDTYWPYLETGNWAYITLNSGTSHAYSCKRGSFIELCDAVKKGRTVLLSKSPWKGDSIKYEPLDDEDIQELKALFEMDPDMQAYENPFNCQPKQKPLNRVGEG